MCVLHLRRRRGQPTAWYTRSHSVARCASLTGTTEKKTTSNIFACCSSCSLIVHLVQVLYYKYLVGLSEFSLSVLQFPSLCRFYTSLSRQEHNWWSYNSKLKMSLDKTYFQPRIFCWSLCKIIDLTKAMKPWKYLGPVAFLTIVVQLVTSDLWNVVFEYIQSIIKNILFS